VVRRFIAVLAVGCFGAVTAPASGSVTIGQLPTNTPPNVTCPAGDYLQPSVTSGQLYIAKQAGRITSWSTVSSGAATYTFKVFRRTSDPDVFQVIAHATEQTLTAGLGTFATDIAVRSGDMIGFRKQGASMGSCTIATPGDAVLQAAGDLADGASGQFSPLADRRLNLAANLVPSNDFQITEIRLNRRQGTASLAIKVSNPGIFTLSGKGLKKRHVARTLPGAGPITFQLAAAGKRKRKLLRKGTVKVPVTLTFAPTNGDPSTQAVGVKLRMRRTREAVG
jgi:hypothetical protein